jgi:hypothetical protein
MPWNMNKADQGSSSQARAADTQDKDYAKDDCEAPVKIERSAIELWVGAEDPPWRAWRDVGGGAQWYAQQRGQVMDSHRRINMEGVKDLLIRVAYCVPFIRIAGEL